MIVLRQGKARNILEGSLDSALAAVEMYNRPKTQFRVENYILLMVIAWTKLFHSFFQTTIGEKYFYKDKNGRYKLIDGERKAWELKECIKEYQKKHGEYPALSKAVVSNLHFFIGLRNKIEHRYWDSDSLDILLFGECQALLYNYENLITQLYGDDYALNTSLAYALQFSHLRASEQIKAQSQLLSNDMKDIKKYIDKYKSELSQEVYDSQEYSIKLLQIPKISNTNRCDLAVEFVHWDTLNADDRANYDKITAIIKDKLVIRPVSNANMLKPSDVVNRIKEQTGQALSTNDHALLWRAFEIRPAKNAESKFNTNQKYCLYDEPHDDYLYSDAWVEFVCNLIVKHGFDKASIRKNCKDKRLNIEDFL